MDGADRRPLNGLVLSRDGRLAAAVSAVREVVVHRRLRQAELAFGAAWTGEAALTVALTVVAFRNGGATAVGIVALVRMVPSAFLAPVLTAAADRMRRERVLVLVSVVRAGAIAAGALVLAAGGPVAAVYVLTVVEAIAFTVFRPVHSALLPSLCTTTRELTSANVVRGTVDSFGALLGPALAGAVLAVGSPTAVFAVAAVLALAGGLMLVGIQYEAVRTTHGRPARVGRDTGEGLRAVVARPELLLIFGLGFAQTLVRGALSVFVVVVALDQLHSGDPGVAALTAAVGAGGLLGSLAVSMLVGSRHLGAWLAMALVLWGAPIALLAAVTHEVPTFVLLAVVGIGNAIIDIPLFTLPVRLAPDPLLARVFSVFESLVALGVGVGAVLTPGLISVVGLRGALVGVGLFLPFLAVVSWRRLNALDERLGVRDDEIRVLRDTPMLRELPVPSIEHLASRLRRRTFVGGSLVCAQGDRGRAFYIIAGGSAAVIGDGALVGVLGPGDSFGEIALVNDVPRTATVQAATVLEVYELDRDDFLDAIGGYRPSSDAADAAVARRLANFSPAAVFG